jgi:hypothetical protein
MHMGGNMFRAHRQVAGFLALALAATLLLGVPGFNGQALAPGGAVASAAARVETAAKAGGDRSTPLVALLTQSTLDLRHLTPAPGEEVVVDLFVTAGRARVRVPAHWMVNSGALPLMGSVADERSRTSASGARPRLVLRGFVLVGKVEVTS